MRIPYEQVIENLNLLAKLRSFDPIIIGTPPLGIDVSGSDIDIACCCNDRERFVGFVTNQFKLQNRFQIRHVTIQGHESIIAEFNAFDWDIEIFCQPIPTSEQWGVRHYRIEQRLLNLLPHLKSKVVLFKRSGLKTEPAFAKALGLTGDPYSAILRLEQSDDHELLLLATSR